MKANPYLLSALLLFYILFFSSALWQDDLQVILQKCDCMGVYILLYLFLFYSFSKENSCRRSKLFSRQKSVRMLYLGNRYKSFFCFSSTRVGQRLAQPQITPPDKDVTIKKPWYWLLQVHAWSPRAELSRLPLTGFCEDRDVWQCSSSEPSLVWEVSYFLFVLPHIMLPLPHSTMVPESWFLCRVCLLLNI